MMPKFGLKSRKKLETCNKKIQKIMHEAIKRMDFTVLCGFRSEEEQNKVYSKGASKLKFPKSRHNKNPSDAIDIAPWPIDWNNLARFRKLASIVKEEAKKLGYKVTWGGDWTTLVDMPHFQIEKGTIKKTKKPIKKKKPTLPNGPSEDDINVSLEDIENQIID